MRLLLIRHGQSTWNAEGRIQGWADPPLNPVGCKQARRLAERLRQSPPAILYSSPLQRALKTAKILGNDWGVPVIVDEGLKEYGIGHVTGLTWQEVVEQLPAVAERWEKAERLAIPGEEGRESFRSRVAATFEALGSRHSEETVGVVAHGGTMGAYLMDLLSLPTTFSPFCFDNGSLSIVESDPVKPRILLLNDTCHLEGAV